MDTIAGYHEVHWKCYYTNVLSMRNTQEQLEVLAQSQSYNILGISETYWEEFSCDWCVMWMVLVGGKCPLADQRFGGDRSVVLKIRSCN